MARPVAKGRLWLIRQGTSRAKVRSEDWTGAKARARAIGFDDPEVIRLIDE
jgi:hypothetical protein